MYSRVETTDIEKERHNKPSFLHSQDTKFTIQYEVATILEDGWSGTLARKLSRLFLNSIKIHKLIYLESLLSVPNLYLS